MALTTLAGLGDCCSGPGATLAIFGNPALENLVGLEPFTSLSRLELTANDKLEDLTGLGGVESIDVPIIGEMCYLENGGPEAVGNASPVTLDGLNALTQVESIQIIGDQMLPEALAEAFAAEFVGPEGTEICANLGGRAVQLERRV